MCIIRGRYFEEEKRMIENTEFVMDEYFREKYNVKNELDGEISIKEKRQRLLEKIMKRDVPEAAKAIDPVKLIREDRDR